ELKLSAEQLHPHGHDEERETSPEEFSLKREHGEIVQEPGGLRFLLKHELPAKKHRAREALRRLCRQLAGRLHDIDADVCHGFGVETLTPHVLRVATRFAGDVAAKVLDFVDTFEIAG